MNFTTQLIPFKKILLVVLVLTSPLLQACTTSLLPITRDGASDEQKVTAIANPATDRPLIAFNDGSDDLCYKYSLYTGIIFFREEMFSHPEENQAMLPLLDQFEPQFADPALFDFLKDLLRSLCTPVQPYRAKLQWALNNTDLSVKGFTRIDQEITIDVASFKEYIVIDGHNTCVFSTNKAYHMENGQWQEFHNLDTPACANPLEIITMPFWPTDPYTIQGMAAHAGIETIAGRSAERYELAIERPLVQKPSETRKTKITVWIDSQSRLPLRIDYRPADGAETVDGSTLFWQLNLEQGTDFVSPLPTTPSRQ